LLQCLGLFKEALTGFPKGCHSTLQSQPVTVHRSLLQLMATFFCMAMEVLLIDVA
jgi:hypothetical protein